MKITTNYTTIIGMSVVALLLIFAFLAHGFAVDLPYHLNPDEPVLIINADELVTRGEIRLRPQYPPLFIWQLALQRILLDSISGSEAGGTIYFFFGRVASLFYALIFASTLIKIGHLFGSISLGIFLGLLMTTEPVGMELHILAKADAISLAFAGLSTLFSIKAWLALNHRHQRHGLILLVSSTIMSILSILAKYNYAPILALPGIIFLWWTWKRGWWKQLLILAILGMITLVVLLTFTDLGATFARYTMHHTATFYTLPSASKQFGYLLSLFGWVGLGLIGLGLAITLFKASKRQTNPHAQLLLILMLVFVASFVVYASTNWSHFRYSYLLFLIASLWLIAGMAWLKRVTHPLIVLLLALIIIIPSIQKSWHIQQQRFVTDARILAGNWLVENIDRPIIVAIEYDAGLVDTQYSGIPLEIPVGRIVVRSIFEQSIDDYWNQNVDYLIVDNRSGGYGGYFAPEVTIPESFQERTREVFRASGGTEIIIFELLQPPRMIAYEAPADYIPAHVNYSHQVGLNSYQVTLTDQLLDIVLAWQGYQTYDDFVYFVQLRRDDLYQPVNINQMPLNYGLSTSLFYEGEIMIDPIQIDLTGIEDGCYQIHVGWYRPVTFEGLLVLNTDGSTAPDYHFPEQIRILDGNAEITTCD